MPTPDKLLEVSHLDIDFLREGAYVNVVRDVNYCLYRGCTLGIVGESGSGKSVSSMALMRLLPMPAARVSRGSARYYPRSGDAPIDLLQLSEQEMCHYRGQSISMIFQEPMTSLNPVQRCGDQVVEMIRLHRHVSHGEARRQTLALFEEVLLPRPEKIFSSYPHEISGGQKQRVMIAMALSCNPDILIADEPTTALDVTVQKTILELLRQLQQRHGIGIIFISHDLGVIAQIADEVAVMYHGEIVEHGTTEQVLHHPQHPYTQGLLACRPPLEGRPKRLPTVSDFLNGTVPAPDIESPEERQARHTQLYAQPPLLEVRNLEVTYTLKQNLFGKPLQQLKGVDGISFDVYRGETLGLVGESGCGKTTLGRSLLRLIDHSAGTITFEGQPIDSLSTAAMRALRRKIQIVFQDPYSSLNPRIPIGEAIMEPLRCHGMGENDEERRQRVLALMQQVGLEKEWYRRYPHEFSGGQRQRVCIARALVLQPELVICDESVSALDVSVQAQVLNLLNDLKSLYGFTYIFITHDLSVVRFLSDRIMVMEKGRMVEIGTADHIYLHPQQAYTQKLIAAIPQV